MSFKINFSLKNFNPSTVEFYRYLLEEHSNENSNIANNIGVPDCAEILQVIRTEFAELHQPDTLSGVLKILESTVRQTSASPSGISTFVKDLIGDCALNEDDQNIAYQIIRQILISLPGDYPMKADDIECIFEKHSIKNTKLQTKLALCRSILIEKFQNYHYLEIVWKQILDEETHYLLVHYIDILITKQNIFTLAECWQLIENLFSSDIRDDRRLGIFLVKKYLKQYPAECSSELVTSWYTYLTIFENLEEKQSHLILPSLGTLPSLKMENHWITILLRKILKHNNTLVLRWSINYLLGTFKFVLQANILPEFLAATNNTWLYNEDFMVIFKSIVIKFDYQKRFLDEFAKISWKSVPMHAWLVQMQTIHWASVESKIIINMSTRLRQLQNRQIRKECRSLFITMFKSHISTMSLDDYVSFVDALYSSTDQLCEHVLLLLLYTIQYSSQPFISYNLFSILRNQESLELCEETLMDAFDELPAEKHQWFAILVFFYFRSSDKIQDFCLRHYGISTPVNQNPDGPPISLEETMNEFVSKLSWDDISKAVVRKATVDWFSGQSDCVNESNFENLLDSGGVTTFENIINPCNMKFILSSAVLTRFLSEFKILIKKNIDIERIVPHLINAANKYDPDFVYKYANEILDIDETNNVLAFNVFKSIIALCSLSNEEGKQLLLRGILFGEPLIGDMRLECEYSAMQAIGLASTGESTREVRELCLEHLKIIDVSAIKPLKDDLIDKSKKLSLQKPRYFENSKHHRLKLRIAQALAALNETLPAWDEYYLTAILEENNQSNVTYIYEFIVATTIYKSDLRRQLLALKDMSVSNQVSMIAISYLYTLHNSSDETFIRKLIVLLIPWTMGANFSTRLSAQITIYHLLRRYKLSSFKYLADSIVQSFKESPNTSAKLNMDIHYNYPNELNLLHTNTILYVTNVPEDEHRAFDLDYLEEYEKLKSARMFNLSSRKISKQKECVIQNSPITEDIQRKMNPEVFAVDNPSHKPAPVKSEMIVVASLIDKLPNLGGIARTCEVLGIENLVLDSTKHVQSRDFQNLSMTAEKWIRISEVKQTGLHEFLIQKKCEGFSIVGAEQTAKSINFTEFIFPKKCVLLLGHEKEGIPVDLIALLDFAVEIPQFGMVRSLNVHVTGAIFMYEYCKQHLMGPRTEIKNK